MKNGLLIRRIFWVTVLISILTLMGSGFVLADGGIFQMSGDITVPEDKIINGDVDSMAGNINIYGTVNGNVTAMAGDVTIYNKVNGNVQSMAGSIYLRNKAEVSGDVIAMAGRVYQDEGSVITGKITELSGGRHGNMSWNIDGLEFSHGNFRINGIPWYIKFWGGVTGLISWLALGALIMFLFATQIQRLAGSVMERPGYYFLIGFLGFLLSPFLIVVLAITIVGIPLIPVAILAVIFGALFGQLAVARVIGNKVKEMFGLHYNTEMARVLVGIVSMFLITLIPIVGLVFFFISLCIGFGVALKNRFGIEKRSDENDT